MGKNGQYEITEFGFTASPGAPPGAEITSLGALLARARRHGRDPYSLMRPSFHQLIAVHSGRLKYAVDFDEQTLQEGAWLWARPGQILQFRSDLAAVDGTVVLFQSGVLEAATAKAARADRPALRTAAQYPAGDALSSTLALLKDEYERLTDLPLEAHLEVVRHLLSVILLRLAHAPGGRQFDGEPGNEPFQRFEQAVERDFAHSRRVEEYARHLGYSVRTLTRATQAAVGCGAKQYLDDRVLLEARRLLVHTDLGTSAVGERLGFPEPTVFTKFYRTRTGETPSAFRARYRN